MHRPLLLWLAAFSTGSPAAVKHRVPEGFVIEQAAGAKQVRFPMFAAFDDRGRLFVAESSGGDLYAELSNQTRKCRVSLLEDKDGDGRFESSRVFADKLVFPMGLVWRAGKLYVADPPDLVALEDTDGDGRADKRTVLLTGFGHKDNGSLHGLTFGPDGLLYMTMGSPDGYKLKLPGGGFLEGESGALLRCRPDGSRPEVLCRGFVNLVEVVFTPSGEIFGTDNWFRNVNAKGSGGLRDALVHLVEGGLYPYHRDVGTPRPITGEPLGPMSLFPAVALSGLARYRGTAFPAEMRGNLFSAQHNARKVGRHVVTPDGSTFRARDFDFVTSEDPDFHPSDVLEDADGSLLVIDTGSWYVHHCPTGQIRKTMAPGGIYRVRRKGAPRVEDPWGLKIDWRAAAPERLCTLLADDRPAVRDRAGLELSARGKAAVPALAAVLAGRAASTVKQRAAWALAAIPDKAALPPLRKALGDHSPEVVATAARTLALREDRKSADLLARLLAGESLPVRRAAADALARCGNSDTLPALWQALAASPDRFLEHALIHAAHRLADARSLKAALAHQSPRVQKAALLLLDQPPRPHDALSRREVLTRAASSDAELRQTAVRVLQKHPEWAKEAAKLVRGWLTAKKLGEQERLGLRGSLLAFQKQPAVGKLITAVVAGRLEKVPADRRVLVLETMAEGGLPKLPASRVEALKVAIQDAAAPVRAQAVRTAAVLQVPQLDEPLAKLAEDRDEPAGLRLEALRAVVARRPKLSPVCFDLLLEQFKDDAGPLPRLAAAEVLGRSRLSDEQARRLLRAAGGDALVSPSLLLPAFPKPVSTKTAAALLDYLGGSIRDGWRPSEQELRKTLDRLPEGSKEKGAKLLALLRDSAEARRARLAEYEPLLKGGDVRRGRAVFFGKKVACAACHRIGDEGGQVGPDLTRVGTVRAGRDLLESIVLPGSTFAQGFESYAVTTSAGRVFSGVIARQSAAALVLRDSAGAEVRLPRNQIESVDRQPTSLMPEGLPNAMTRDEFRDLLAYLRSLK